jgi:hypothetical protein
MTPLIRLLAAFAALFFAWTAAQALDLSSVGTYAIVHSDGHVTDRTFRVTHAMGRWRVEDRKSDGTWSDVTCQHDCVLQESNAEHLLRFFGALELNAIQPSCVHNKAFAFCSHTLRSKPKQVSHVLVVLVTDKPTPIRLVRLKERQVGP